MECRTARAIFFLQRSFRKKRNAKKIIIEVDKKNIIIRPFTKQAKGTEEFEKMELIVGDYRVYTHRPGGMKIRRISDNKQLAVYGDKMNLKFYNKQTSIIYPDKIEIFLLKFFSLIFLSLFFIRFIFLFLQRKIKLL